MEEVLNRPSSTRMLHWMPGGLGTWGVGASGPSPFFLWPTTRSARRRNFEDALTQCPTKVPQRIPALKRRGEGEGEEEEDP